jgi:CMP-N-acetylneuraminic acid synthetase
MLDRNAPSCTSVVAVESHPHLMHKVDKSQRLQRFLDAPQSSRRQDLPELFELNGALYIADIEWLMDNRTFVTSETVGYEMTRRESVDIDDVDDLALAEFYLDRSSQAQI